MKSLSRPWHRSNASGAVLLLVAAILLRSWFFLSWDEAYFDSDQAIVGLMAKHITEGRAWPLFFYGQEYMLAVEAWAMAPVFLLLGPTVFALHFTMLLFNVAAALLLWWLLMRDAALSPVTAAVTLLPFALAPVILSAHLIEAQGGNPEPFLWVAILWAVRRRPLLLGALAAVAFLHREFTIYAIPALIVTGVVWRTSNGAGAAGWRDELRHWAMVAFAAIVVFLSIQALKPMADLMGPHSAGLRAPDRPQDNLQQLQGRIEWNAAAVPARLEAVASELYPMLLGVGALDPKVVAVNSTVPVGWPALAPLVAVAALLWPVGLWRSEPTPGRRGTTLLPLYLVLVGVQSGLVYAVTREPSVLLLRYALLSLLAPIGIAALLLQRWRPRVWRLATGLLLAILAGAASIDHVRVIRQSYVTPMPPRFTDAAARLLERGVRVGRAGYWRAYAITFLTGEAVKLTSTEVLRIQEYEALADASEPQVVVLQERSCAAGIPEERVGVWYLCGP